MLSHVTNFLTKKVSKPFLTAGLAPRHQAGGGGPGDTAADVRAGLAHRAIRPQLGEGKDYANDELFDNLSCSQEQETSFGDVDNFDRLIQTCALNLDTLKKIKFGPDVIPKCLPQDQEGL